MATTQRTSKKRRVYISDIKLIIFASTVHDFNESMRYNSNTVIDTDLN